MFRIIRFLNINQQLKTLKKYILKWKKINWNLNGFSKICLFLTFIFFATKVKWIDTENVV